MSSLYSILANVSFQLAPRLTHRLRSPNTPPYLTLPCTIILHVIKTIGLAIIIAKTLVTILSKELLDYYYLVRLDFVAIAFYIYGVYQDYIIAREKHGLHEDVIQMFESFKHLFVAGVLYSIVILLVLLNKPAPKTASWPGLSIETKDRVNCEYTTAIGFTDHPNQYVPTLNSTTVSDVSHITQQLARLIPGGYVHRAVMFMEPLIRRAICVVVHTPGLTLMQCPSFVALGALHSMYHFLEAMQYTMFVEEEFSTPATCDRAGSSDENDTSRSTLMSSRAPMMNAFNEHLTSTPNASLDISTTQQQPDQPVVPSVRFDPENDSVIININ